MCVNRTQREKVAVFGGRPRTIEKAFIPRLVDAGADVISYSEFDAVVPVEATAAIVVITKCSHNLSDKVRDWAVAHNIKFATVSHQWSRAEPYLLQVGIINKTSTIAPQGGDEEEETDMSNDEMTNRMKAALSSEISDLTRRLDELAGHHEALAGLVTESTPDALRGQIKELTTQLQHLDGKVNAFSGHTGELLKLKERLKQVEDSTTGFLTKVSDQAKAADKRLDAADEQIDRSRGRIETISGSVVKLIEQVETIENRLDALEARPTAQQAAPDQAPSAAPQPALPEEPPLKVNTQEVAQRILADLEVTYPHPLTKVAWKEAAKALGLTADLLVDSLTTLYGNEGLNESLLNPLAKCGWTLALVHNVNGVAYPLTGGPTLTVTQMTQAALETAMAKPAAPAPDNMDQIVEGIMDPPTIGQRVVNAVKAAAPRGSGKLISKDEIVKATGLTPKQVSDHLSHAARKGQIMPLGSGNYQAA